MKLVAVELFDDVVMLALYVKPLETALDPVALAVVLEFECVKADEVPTETGLAVDEVPFPVIGAECVCVAITVLPLLVSVQSVV